MCRWRLWGAAVLCAGLFSGCFRFLLGVCMVTVGWAVLTRWCCVGRRALVRFHPGRHSVPRFVARAVIALVGCWWASRVGGGCLSAVSCVLSLGASVGVLVGWPRAWVLLWGSAVRVLLGVVSLCLRLHSPPRFVARAVTASVSSLSFGVHAAVPALGLGRVGLWWCSLLCSRVGWWCSVGAAGVWECSELGCTISRAWGLCVGWVSCGWPHLPVRRCSAFPFGLVGGVCWCVGIFPSFRATTLLRRDVALRDPSGGSGASRRNAGSVDVFDIRLTRSAARSGDCV